MKSILVILPKERNGGVGNHLDTHTLTLEVSQVHRVVDALGNNWATAISES
jgi:hypothetical protein